MGPGGRRVLYGFEERRDEVGAAGEAAGEGLDREADAVAVGALAAVAARAGATVVAIQIHAVSVVRVGVCGIVQRQLPHLLHHLPGHAARGAVADAIGRIAMNH